MIKPSEHTDLIERLLNKYALVDVKYKVVLDVDRWCIDKGYIPESDYYPFRQAKTLYNIHNNEAKILFCSELTDDMIDSGKARMRVDGFSSEVKKLHTDIEYFEHLLLHELACVVLKINGQASRDQWAFNEMCIGI